MSRIGIGNYVSLRSETPQGRGAEVRDPRARAQVLTCIGDK